MELQKKGNICLQVFLSFLGTYGVCYLLKLAQMQEASFSILSILVMPALFFLLKRTGENLESVESAKQRKRRICYGAVVSFLFSVSMIMGYQLQVNGLTECGFTGKGLIFLRALCLSIAVFPFGDLLFAGIEKIGSGRGACSRGKDWKPGAVFGITAGIVFACLIPVWLAYYPAIMSYDFHRQVNEAANGFAWFMPYQPLLHTWLIWVCLQLGNLWGDLQAGISALSMLHMVLYSLVTAYGVSFVYRCCKRKWAVVALVLFFGIFPLNIVMVLCTTKDVLFSILFLLFVLLLAERFWFCEGRRKLVIDVLLVLEGCLMMQFRNNAIYAVAVFGVLWVLFAAKKEKLRILLLCVLLVAGGKGTGVAVKAAIGTNFDIWKQEMYSVPAQQFARVGYYHGEELDAETYELLDFYLPAEGWQDYNPSIADAIKAWVGGEPLERAWVGHTSQLLKDWVKIGLRYPNEFLDAFLELTRGYWFWDDRSHAENLGYGLEERMGVIFTYNSSASDSFEGIEHESKFPWLEKQLENIVSANSYYDWPVLSILCKCAFYVWGLFLVFLASIYQRQKKLTVLCLLPLMYLGTILLGPVAWLRYVYPFMLSLPVLVGLLTVKNSREE